MPNLKWFVFWAIYDATESDTVRMVTIASVLNEKGFKMQLLNETMFHTQTHILERMGYVQVHSAHTIVVWISLPGGKTLSDVYYVLAGQWILTFFAKIVLFFLFFLHTSSNDNAQKCFRLRLKREKPLEIFFWLCSWCSYVNLQKLIFCLDFFCLHSRSLGNVRMKFKLYCKCDNIIAVKWIPMPSATEHHHHHQHYAFKFFGWTLPYSCNCLRANKFHILCDIRHLVLGVLFLSWFRCSNFFLSLK